MYRSPRRPIDPEKLRRLPRPLVHWLVHKLPGPFFWEIAGRRLLVTLADFTRKGTCFLALEPCPCLPSGCVFTEREEKVYYWLQLGKSNPHIALITGLSVSQVKTSAGRIYQKLGVENRTDAALFFLPLPDPPPGGS